jgi:hypothetical protein
VSKQAYGQELWDKFNELMALWEEMERRLQGPPVVVHDRKLSIGKYSGRVRILYDGRPLTECRMRERVDAVKDLGELIAARQEVLSGLMTDATQACNDLRNYLTLLPEKEPADDERTDHSGS